MDSFQEYKDDFVLFLEAGFIAVNQADEQSANKLFAAAKLLEPTNVLPIVGEGYLYLHLLHVDKAAQKFEEVLKIEPENEMAKAFLGITYTLTPDHVTQGEQILSQIQKSDDKEIKKLSETALDFVDKLIKKDASPAQIKKEK
ncbi:MAG TPA: hypothetical protein P5048_00035 [Chlamydiales bacterium]|nr:hypothetical protein [Chlamydiales bacterium]